MTYVRVGKVESESVGVIQPSVNLIGLLIDRRRVKITKQRTRVPSAASITRNMPHVQPRGLALGRGEDLSLVPEKTPKCRSDSVTAGIDRNVIREGRSKGVVLVTKDPDARAGRRLRVHSQR